MAWSDLGPTTSGTELRITEQERDGLVAHWRRRAVSESRIGRGFSAMSPRLREVGAPTVVVQGCHDAAAEEHRHAELCLSMAARYAGAEVSPAAEPPFEMPDFRTGDERLELLFLVVGTCCINETLAVGYIRACMDAATDPIAVRANRAHLRDEIGHGRLGWALLGSSWVDESLRGALHDRLPRLLGANVPLWLRPDPELGPEGAPHLGHPSAAKVHDVILRTLQEAILPGFARAGLDTDGLAAPFLR